MVASGNIVIGDRSALHLLTHCDVADTIEKARCIVNPMLQCAGTAEELRAFNMQNPLYGPTPISLLVPDATMRRHSKGMRCAVCPPNTPAESFFELREGLFIATPELVFLRMACLVNVNQLAEIGMQLCARYFIDRRTGELHDRKTLLTTPERLHAYVDEHLEASGTAKAKRALVHVVPNSKSPMENKAALLFSMPMRYGGFNLKFNVMNLEVRPTRRDLFASQESYSIDIVNTNAHVGLEYDGKDTHPDPSHDIQRRNELKALGWEVFPLDSRVLYSPALSIHFAEQVAKYMGMRMRYPKSWDEKNLQLRRDLDLER